MSATDDLLAAARANPADARATRRALEALAAEKRWRDEAELRELIIDSAPGGERHLTALARAWEQAGEPDRAADALMRAADAEPTSFRAVKAAFTALVARGRHAEAARFVPEVVAGAPRDLSIVGKAIAVYDALGRVDEAQALAAAATEKVWRPNIPILERHLPHVVQYYECGHLRTPLPFVMYGGSANFTNAVFSTDAEGYRYSVTPDGTRFAPGDDPVGCGNALVTGGSTAFGVGATGDHATLASMLSDGDTNFYNLGRVAYVLQQNTIDYLFLTGRLPTLRKVVLLAGINDLAAPKYSKVFPTRFGTFFGWDPFFKAHGRLQANFPEAYWPQPLRSQFLVEDSPDAQPEDGRVADVLAQMLRCWKMFADAQGAKVTFVLQPVSFWIDRKPAPAEVNLFAEQDGAATPEDLAIQRFIAQSYPSFASDVARACEATGVDFIDANPLMAAHSEAGGFLFADYCHLTDDGTRVLAEVLAPHLNLAPCPWRKQPSPPVPPAQTRRPRQPDSQSDLYPLW